MKIGYSRVSTEDQNLDRQLDILREKGCDEVFYEKMSGMKTLPVFKRVVRTLKKGDTLMVDELSRLGRSTPDIVVTAHKIMKKGVIIICIKEGIDTSTDMGPHMFYLFSVVSGIERKFISERTKSGLRATKARGTKLGRKFQHLEFYVKNRHRGKEFLLKRMSLATYYKLRRLVNNFNRKAKSTVCELYGFTPALYDNYAKVIKPYRVLQKENKDRRDEKNNRV